METYYNTNNESGATLKKSRTKAQNQQEVILNVMRTNSDTGFTPCEIWGKYFEADVPITSIRRAITNLEKNNDIIKTTVMRTGLFGKMVHTWKCPHRESKQKKLF